MVESCLYNYAVCDDGFSIRAAFFQQILKGDMNSNLNLSDCFDSMIGCDVDILKSIDSTSMCDSRCNSTACEYCMGLSSYSNTCKRSYTINPDYCLLCLDKYQIQNYCIDSCPSGYSVVGQLTPLFFNTSVCLKDPESSSPNKFFRIYVNETGSSDGLGTLVNPTNSIFQAFSKATRKYTMILISQGTFNFSQESTKNPLINDPMSPLNFIINLNLEEL